MRHAEIIQFPQHEKKPIERRKRKQDQINSGKTGRVYARKGKLWVDFYYLDQRIREPTGLEDTPASKRLLRKQLDLVVAEIENNTFQFAKRFPHSKKKDFFTELETGTIRKEPADICFKDYVKEWMNEMKPGMSVSQIRDYISILSCHLLPYFGEMTFNEFSPVQMKKFLAKMKSKKVGSGKKISAKRIQNVMIPLRIIARDAIIEFNWSNLPDPFSGLKLPKIMRPRVSPFSYREWKILLDHMLDWYRPYFEFAVQTGLRPSEQVALKWTAIDDEFVHIELSRVRNLEKQELKTTESRRSIAIRPAMAKVLEKQRKMTKPFQSDYVFMNSYGRPILQDKLRESWVRVLKKTGLNYRRMYETRHTFASWALAAGESPEWVARTLGHVDTSMVYRTYGRYIPNLTRRDGSAFEKQFMEETNKKGDTK